MDQALSALEAVEQSFGQQTATFLARANLLKQQSGDSAAYEYLLEQWQSSNNTRLMPSLLGLAKSVAPDTLDELTDNWIKQTPESITAHLARAEWLMTNGKEIAAINHYEQVVSRQPKNIAALNNLAWLLRESDQPQALTLAKKASELAPENAAVLDTYGWILHLSGKHSEAQDMIEKALALAPDNEEIQQHLQAVKQSL